MTKLVLLAMVVACSKASNEPQSVTLDPPPAPPPTATVDASPPSTRGVVLEGAFATPESVLYDADADLYLVSNINGKPLDTDDNGYITKLAPDGKATTPKWIDGGEDKVKLDAPKGMAISGGVLWVADITVVRQFDAKTGAPKGEVKIEGATFLNDIAPAPNGGVYVTDMGVNDKFAPTGTDAVYLINSEGKMKALIKKGLEGPNGVTAGADGSIWVVTFRSGEIFQIDAKGKKQQPQKLPKGQLDGVIALPSGEFLVSSWEGATIYRGKPGGEWKSVVENVKSPADIGFDTKRNRLLIPSFQSDTVILQPLE